MHNKVLIDYDEYVRLSKAAHLCEELLKNKQGRGGYLSEIIASKEAKDAISHRSRAFAKLREYFLTETDAITASIALKR